MSMHGRNGHLTVLQMDRLPFGSQVVDGNSDIHTKGSDNLWICGDSEPVTSDKVYRLRPIRRWTGVSASAVKAVRGVIV